MVWYVLTEKPAMIDQIKKWNIPGIFIVSDHFRR
jgi:hypothetical protein